MHEKLSPTLHPIYTPEVNAIQPGHSFLFSDCILSSVNNSSEEQQTLLRLSQNGPVHFFPSLYLSQTPSHKLTLHATPTPSRSGMLSHSHHYQRPHTPPTYQLLLFEEAVLLFFVWLWAF